MRKGRGRVEGSRGKRKESDERVDCDERREKNEGRRELGEGRGE